MSFSVDDRVLALAGIAQALQQVRRIAETGHSEAAVVRTAVESVFRIDAASPQEIYGSASNVAPGLRLLHNYLSSQGQDEHLPRLALSVLQLERRFVREHEIVAKVSTGIERAQSRDVLADGRVQHREELGDHRHRGGQRAIGLRAAAQ